MSELKLAESKLAELEAQADELEEAMLKGTWEWAVIMTQIHDEKLFPKAGEPHAWEEYIWVRWDMRRAQAFNIVAWVHDENRLALSFSGMFALPDGEGDDAKSTAVDSPALPPAIPVYSTGKASRTARNKSKAREKPIMLSTVVRTKIHKQLEEAHKELGDEAFYGLCGDLTEDLDDAMSDIDEERDGPLV